MMINTWIHLQFLDIKDELDFTSKKMNNNLHSNFVKLRDLIYSISTKLDMKCVCDYSDFSFANEIIAYLFVIYYGMKKESNINKYHTEKENAILDQMRDFEKEPLDDGNIDFGRIDRNREREKYLRYGNKEFLSRLEAMNIAVPHIDEIECLNQGRSYDEANMIMIDEQVDHQIEINGDGKHRQKHTLFDLLLSKDICNSHSVSAYEIAEAYKDFNETYEHAKTITDPKRYIDHWVNFYRLEIRMSYSLISKIADYMIENGIKEFPDDAVLADLLWKPTIVELLTHRRPSDAIAVLQYHSWIPTYFNEYDITKMYYDAWRIRAEKALLINLVTPVAQKAFAPYFNNESRAILEMFSFCTKDYPVIEQHEFISLYIDKDNKKLNHKKIKLIRKIFKVLTPPDEIKKYFDKEKHGNCKKSV